MKKVISVVTCVSVLLVRVNVEVEADLESWGTLLGGEEAPRQNRQQSRKCSELGSHVRSSLSRAAPQTVASSTGANKQSVYNRTAPSLWSGSSPYSLTSLSLLAILLLIYSQSITFYYVRNPYLKASITTIV